MENIDYARVFEEIADLLEIQGANPFRVRAYRNGARTIETLSQPLESLLAEVRIVRTAQEEILSVLKGQAAAPDGGASGKSRR